MEKLLAQKKLATRWYERFPRGVPVGIFVLTMAVTLLSVFAIERAENTSRATQLVQTARLVTSGVERRANSYATYLRSGAALFATQRFVEAPLFRTFIRQLHLDGHTAGSDGIGWAMKVYPGDIATVEKIMRAGGAPDFRIHGNGPPGAASGQPFRVPVIFLEPESPRNRRAIGFDMYSEAVRRQAMDTAERTGQPIASGKVILLQEGPAGQAGFLVYMPVYTLVDSAGRDYAGRGEPVQGKLRGFVYSPFNAQRFLESAIDVSHLNGAGVRLYDPLGAQPALMAEIAPASRSGQVVRRPIEISGRRFLLEIEARDVPVLSPMSVMSLAFGLLVASLLLVLARLLTQQAVEDRIALAWFEQQSSIRNSLTRELNHRVKNTLANVLSIISLTRRRASSLNDFADSLEGRIRALSATHDLLTQSDWGATPVAMVVQAELAPYAQDTARHLVMAGPDVELAPNDALSLGLAIHELATNAAKYGALSVESGEVSVRWHLASENRAQVEWVERGGPPIDAEQRRKRGFGTELIEKIVAHELRNPVDLRFEPEGVRCTLVVPVRHSSGFAIRTNR